MKAPRPSTPSSTKPTNRLAAARLSPSGILGPFSLSAGCSDDVECCRRGLIGRERSSLQRQRNRSAQRPHGRCAFVYRPVGQLGASTRVSAGGTTPTYATCLATSSGAILPPDSTTTAVLATISGLPARSAASATAPPGSTTSLSSWNAKPTARSTSPSVAVPPSATRV